MNVYESVEGKINMLLHSKNELYQYLNNVDWNIKKENKFASVYFLIKYGQHIEPIYFTQFEDVYFESPCDLRRIPLEENKLSEFVKDMYYADDFEVALEYEKILQKEGWHYDIECWQCSPFLPEEIEVIDMLSETECLEWLLKHYKM